MAYTRACFSPCLMVEPEKATSPANFFAGSDSPVSAAWSICKHYQAPLRLLHCLQDREAAE